MMMRLLFKSDATRIKSISIECYRTGCLCCSPMNAPVSVVVDHEADPPNESEIENQK